jgi:hypothetical protein
MTTQDRRLRKNVSIGARAKLTGFDDEGITVSLANNFKPSAMGCNRPKNPTTLGPFRCCIADITLRSAAVRNATDKRTIRTTRRLLTRRRSISLPKTQPGTIYW